MTVILFGLLGLAAAGGFGIAWGIRDAAHRAERRAENELPPFISTHWKNRWQREQWRRLSPEQKAEMVDRIQGEVDHMHDDKGGAA